MESVIREEKVRSGSGWKYLFMTRYEGGDLAGL